MKKNFFKGKRKKTEQWKLMNVEKTILAFNETNRSQKPQHGEMLVLPAFQTMNENAFDE